MKKKIVSLIFVCVLGAQSALQAESNWWPVVRAQNLLSTVVGCIKSGASYVRKWTVRPAVRIIDKSGDILIDCAKKHPYLSAATLFAGIGLCAYKDGFFNLTKAVWHNNFWRAKLLLQTGMISAREKRNALYSALQRKQLEFVKLIVSYGTSVIGDDSFLPLAEVAFHGDAEIVEFLLKNGAQPDINKSWHRQTSLEYAWNNPQTFFTLLQHGADPFIHQEGVSGNIVELVANDRFGDHRVAQLARLLFLIENSPVKIVMCKDQITMLENSIKYWQDCLEDYNRELAFLLLDEVPNQARIEQLNDWIFWAEEELSQNAQSLKRIQLCADSVMTPEKQNMAVEIITSLTEEEKEEYRKVLSVRYQHTHNLLIALMLYNYFDDGSALQMYCNGAISQQKPLEVVRCSSTYNLLIAVIAKLQSAHDFNLKMMLEKTFYLPVVED